MNTDLKKKMSRILALSLTLAMAVVFVPQMAAPAYANNGVPAIVTGSSVLAENAGNDAAQKVFYGDRVWYVIAYDQKDGDGNVVSYKDPSGVNKPLYQKGTATLLQEGVGDHTVFNSEKDLPYSCAYGWMDSDSENPQTPSNLRSFIDSRYLTGYDNEGTHFAAYLSVGEQAAIKPRRLDGDGGYFNSQNYDQNKIYGAAVESAYLWPLSDAEVSVLPNSIKVVGQGVYWWLRSAGAVGVGGQFQQAVDDYGKIRQGQFPSSVPLGVRPAFDLNLQSVLFTSAAEGGKSSGTAGAGALTAVGNNSGNEWKLTVADNAHSAFAVSDVIASGNGVSVYYTGAATGDNEYISAIITDKPITDSAAKIKYYGRIAAASDAKAHCRKLQYRNWYPTK